MKSLLVIFVFVVIAATEGEAGQDESFGDAAFQDDLVRVMMEAERLHMQERLSQAQKPALYSNDEAACYEYLGCFRKDPIGILPEGPDDIRPNFHLFTQVAAPRMKKKAQMMLHANDL